jgi:hypothetical protein
VGCSIMVMVGYGELDCRGEDSGSSDKRSPTLNFGRCRTNGPQGSSQKQLRGQRTMGNGGLLMFLMQLCKHMELSM